MLYEAGEVYFARRAEGSTFFTRARDMTRAIIAPSFQLMSNWCALGCAGCGIRVAPPAEGAVVKLARQYLENARSNLHIVKSALQKAGIDYCMVEQSGGEPAHHPELVELVGELFGDVVHKVITNGQHSEVLLDYALKRGANICLVMSIEHHEVECNRVRFGEKFSRSQALQIHSKVMDNLDLFARRRVPLVVSTIISKWNIDKYLGFVEWLEKKYPEHIRDGLLTPLPVSLVAFGNQQVGKLNPSIQQVEQFDEAIADSALVSIQRMRHWFFSHLNGLYRHKHRHFQRGETLKQIATTPSKATCEIFPYMMSFNFQDEEILREPTEALFEGYACGVKVLGNIGHPIEENDTQSRIPIIGKRPCNMSRNKLYYGMHQIQEYIDLRDRIHVGHTPITMGQSTGDFRNLRMDMCMLDDFDGVWWPFNAAIQGFADFRLLGEFWSLFRHRKVGDVLARIQADRDISESAYA